MSGLDHSESSESLESLRQSFSYGTRNDLNFKFLKTASDGDAASFVQELLHRLGDAYDTGDAGPLIEAAYEAQIAGIPSSPWQPDAEVCVRRGSVHSGHDVD